MSKFGANSLWSDLFDGAHKGVFVGAVVERRRAKVPGALHVEDEQLRRQQKRANKSAPTTAITSIQQASALEHRRRCRRLSLGQRATQLRDEIA